MTDQAPNIKRARAVYAATNHLKLSEIQPLDLLDRLSLLTVAAGLRQIGVLEGEGLQLGEVKDATGNCGLQYGFGPSPRPKQGATVFWNLYSRFGQVNPPAPMSCGCMRVQRTARESKARDSPRRKRGFFWATRNAVSERISNRTAKWTCSIWKRSWRR